VFTSVRPRYHVALLLAQPVRPPLPSVVGVLLAWIEGYVVSKAELERVFSKAGKLHDDQRKSVLDVTLK
jgi:hypothetical protein